MAVAQVLEDLPEDVKDKLAELDLELSEGECGSFSGLTLFQVL
jgi:hypothetical protein